MIDERTDDPAAPRSTRQRFIVSAAAIMALTIIAYLPALAAGFIWDDDMYITKNPALRSVEGLCDIWFKLGATPQYYPLVFTTFWLEFQIWEKSALGYHAINVLLHGLSAILLWRALRRLNVPGAWMAAAVFALHPVNVESVAWITERKNVLSGVLYLTALLCYMRFTPFEESGAGAARRWKFYWLALLAFVGALLGKTVTASLPAAILLLLWWKRPDGRLRPGDVVPLLPMFVLGAAMGMITATMEREHVGALGPDWDFSSVDRILIAGRAVWFYASKLAWPANLTFIYERWEIDSGAAWQYLFPIAALALVVALWLLRSRIGKGPLVAALFFGGTLFPALGFFNIYPMLFSFVADHFQYLASIGPIVLLTAIGVMLLRRLDPMVQRIAAGSLLLFLAALTFIQSLAYHDVVTLWTNTLLKNPNAWIAHDNLSQALGERGDFARAAEHAMASLQLREENSVAHNNLGLALESLGYPEQAMEHYQRAIEITPKRVLARLNLASLQFRRNDLAAAEENYRCAVQDAPLYPEAHYNLAVFLGSQGRTDEAMEMCLKALELDGADPQTRTLYGKLLLDRGRVAEAIAEFQEALRLNPDHEMARQLLESAQSK